MSVSVQTLPASPSAARKRTTHRPKNTALIERRLDKGWSPNDLARMAQVSGNSVRLAEDGFLVTPRIQGAIARALECGPLDIWPLDFQMKEREARRKDAKIRQRAREEAGQ